MMATTLLERGNALSSGSDLWLLANTKESKWTNQLDWYLNFSILRSSVRPSQQISETLKTVVTDCEFDFKKYHTDSDAPTLIESAERLPCRWIAILPECDREEQWVNRSHQLWKNLQKPSLRVFVPDNYNQKALFNHWQKLSKSDVVTIVPPKD